MAAGIMRKQKRNALIALLAPPLFFMILFVIFPLVSSGYYSLLEWDGMSEGTFVGLDNFVEMLRKGKIFAAIFNTTSRPSVGRAKSPY